MYSVEDILARLQKGESQEDIVKEFTDAMNKASQEKAKKDQETEAKAARKQAGEELILAVRKYLKVAHPEIAADVRYDTMAVDEYLDLLDSSLRGIVALKSIDWDKMIDDSLDKIFSAPKTKPTADDILNAWIKKI